MNNATKLKRYWDICVACGITIESAQAYDERGQPFCNQCWNDLEDLRRRRFEQARGAENAHEAIRRGDEPPDERGQKNGAH